MALDPGTEGKVFAHIDSLEGEMVNALMELIRIPALDPRNAGEGEEKKAQCIERLIAGFGFDEIKRYNAPDPRVPGGYRPNIIAKVRGSAPGEPPAKGTLWVVTHMDIVPPGDLKSWTTDPYEPVLREGKVYGRGAEDNGQELVASLYAVKALKDMEITPERDIGLAIVADEETGSEKGIKHIIKEGIFGENDLIVVPDHGTPDGTFIEVSEKSILWLKITTSGKQCHASMPQQGVNAFKAAIKFAYKLDEALHARFPDADELFDPPVSTFEPTKKDANVPNVNTIPGEDVFYIDCRVLPRYEVDAVMATVREVAESVERETGAKINIEVVQREPAAPPTSPDAPVVKLLEQSVRRVYGVEPKVGGIGGGTCAAIFRRAGLHAAVWAKLEETCHAPNEYAVVDNLVNDAKVYALMFTS